MGLSQALSAALAGVNVTQQSLSVIAGNVANANTPGYVAESVNQSRCHDCRSNRGQRRYHRDKSRSRILCCRASCGPRRPAALMPTRPRSFISSSSRFTARPDPRLRLTRIYNNFTTALQVAVDEPRLILRPVRRGRCRAGAGAKSQFDDHERPAAAHPGGAGHRQRRADGEQCVAADRPDQSCSSKAVRPPTAPQRRSRTSATRTSLS